MKHYITLYGHRVWIAAEGDSIHDTAQKYYVYNEKSGMVRLIEPFDDDYLSAKFEEIPDGNYEVHEGLQEHISILDELDSLDALPEKIVWKFHIDTLPNRLRRDRQRLEKAQNDEDEDE
jgi:hypothetical protein